MMAGSRPVGETTKNQPACCMYRFRRHFYTICQSTVINLLIVFTVGSFVALVIFLRDFAGSFLDPADFLAICIPLSAQGESA
jgi:hypothetical protein